MPDSLSKTPSRFTVFLVFTNLSILLLLLFWLWQYWHSGVNLVGASQVDELFDRQAHFLKIPNGYLFEPYIFDFVFIIIPTLIVFLGYGIAEQTKRFTIADTLFVIHSTLVLVACLFIQSKIGVLHLWVSTGIAAVSQNALSFYLIDRKEAENQNFNITFSRILWVISLFTFILEIFGLATYLCNLIRWT